MMYVCGSTVLLQYDIPVYDGTYIDRALFCVALGAVLSRTDAMHICMPVSTVCRVNHCGESVDESWCMYASPWSSHHRGGEVIWLYGE